jgi:hypothetical protein
MLCFKRQELPHMRSLVHARMLLSLAVTLISFIIISALLVSCGSARTVQATPKHVATLAPTSTPTPTPQPPTPQPPTPTPQPPAPQAEPATLDLQPTSMSIIGHLDCQRTTVYVCQARVLSRSSNQSNLHWTAFTNIPGQIVFSPSGGVLAPGQSVLVTLFVPFTSCTPGLFSFQGPINTHTIAWAC